MAGRIRAACLMGVTGLVLASGLGGCEPSSTQAAQASREESQAKRERDAELDRFLEHQQRREKAARRASKADWAGAAAALDTTPHAQASPEEVARSLVIYMARRDAERSFPLLSRGFVERLDGLVREAEEQIRSLGMGDPRHAPFKDAAAVWRALVAQGKTTGGPDDLGVTATVDGDEAIVRAVHGGTGEVQTIRAVREGGLWKLDLAEQLRLKPAGAARGG